ncbi:MAG: hypothetical protein Q7R87_04785 [Nanoarchaeota archaeon]|nr:hypothetical protein [Nanoarchaeota archaeon]
MEINKINRINNKRGESYLEGNVVYIILFILFLMSGMAFLYKYQNNVYFWEQYYSYTIAKSVNNAQVGDRVELNMGRSIELANKEGIADYKKLVSFDNTKKEVVVSLQKGKKTTYSFLRNYNVNDVIIEEDIKGYFLKFSVGAGGLK